MQKQVIEKTLADLSTASRSRDQHTNGFKHKGNVERYINSLYKKGRQEKRDRAEEAAVVAAINAVRSSHLTAALRAICLSCSPQSDRIPGAFLSQAAGDTSEPPAASTSKKPAKPQKFDPYANYSHAATLGMVDKDYEAAQAAAKEAQSSSEGNVGQWTSVSQPQQPSAASSRSQGFSLDPEAGMSATAREEHRPTSKTFKEKTLDQDDLWDPALSIRLKSDRNVKREEPASGSGGAAAAAQTEEPTFKSRKRGFKAAFDKSSAEPQVKQEEPSEATTEPAAIPEPEAAEEVKPEPDTEATEPASEAPAPTLFKKKRKGGNGGNNSSAAQRRKLD